MDEPPKDPWTSRKRPVLRLPLSPVEVALLIVAVAGVVACAVPLARAWSTLPAIVPTHFGASGQPNAYGGKESLLLLPALALILTVGFIILARYPHLFNYPVDITPENAPRMYRLGRLTLRWLNAGMVWLFAVLEWQTLQIVRGNATALPGWFLPVTLAFGLLVPLIALLAFIVRSA